MDIQMPEMDGYETENNQNRNEWWYYKSDSIIITMTASSLIADKTKYLLLGMNSL
jgi:CheY-like chemotaxis protein